MAEKLILEEQTHTSVLNSMYGYVVELSPAPFLLTVGHTYRVVWDGNSYECVAVDGSATMESAVFIGGNNEPFTIGTVSAVNAVLCLCLTDTAQTSHTVAVYQMVEETAGIDIVLKDRNGKNIEYPGINVIKVKRTDGETQSFAAYDPETLIPENVIRGVTVGNVIGTAVIPENAETAITPDFSGGDMVVTPGEGAMFSKVTVQKPENLLPGNIAEGVDIAGIVGTLAGGGNVHFTLNSDGEVSAAKLDGFTTIPTGCFAYMNALESVDLSDSPNITSIGDHAFESCTALTSITIPEGVTSIGDYAFNGCAALTSITIPEGVTSIGNSAFMSCKALTSVTIPDSVTSIGSVAFCGCSALTSITIPDSVTSISAQIFQNCSALTSVNIPDGVTNIGIQAFMGCSALTSITIPARVEIIGNNTFSNCTKLTSVAISDGVTSISKSMFSGCTALTRITIPASVKSIGSYAFSNCNALTSVTFKDTSGWYVTTTQNATSGTSVSVSNAATAASYLTNTYKTYFWYDKT